LNQDAERASTPKLSYLPFFVKAAAVSLKRYPLLNAWYDEDRQSVDTQDVINIGFALDAEQGFSLGKAFRALIHPAAPADWVQVIGIAVFGITCGLLTVITVCILTITALIIFLEESGL